MHDAMVDALHRLDLDPSELGAVRVAELSSPQHWAVHHTNHGHHTMTRTQKTELNWLFDDGVPFYLAKEMIGLQNSEDAFDASYTWRRWQTELEAWGFYSF